MIDTLTNETSADTMYTDKALQSSKKLISIICPCYNESKTVGLFIDSINKTMKNADADYEIIFINDGSTDDTLNCLTQLKQLHPTIRIIDLSRNFGKEVALTAGLDHAKGDALIPIDVDLQDPPELILEMLNKWQEGYDVVLAKRVDRSADSIAKRKTADWFYQLHNKISHIKIPQNVGDFRLIDRKVADALKQLPERQRFMKGLFAWVGFNTTEIEYTRPERIAGDTKFNTLKLLNLAVEGITSFSNAPLRIWSFLGILLSSFSFLYGLFIILRTLFFGIDTPGYASLLTVILFFSGIQMLGLGVLGEYIGKIHTETKLRPLYIIKEEY